MRHDLEIHKCRDLTHTLKFILTPVNQNNSVGVKSKRSLTVHIQCYCEFVTYYIIYEIMVYCKSESTHAEYPSVYMRSILRCIFLRDLKCNLSVLAEYIPNYIYFVVIRIRADIGELSK